MYKVGSLSFASFYEDYTSKQKEAIEKDAFLCFELTQNRVIFNTLK